MEVVAARLPKDVARVIEQIAKEDKTDKSSVIARATDLYVKDWKLSKAIRFYQEGKVTVMKGANLANISIWEFLEELDKRKIPLQYSVEEFVEDFQAPYEGHTA